MSVQKFLLYPFHCKPRLLGVILESSGLENIPPSSGKSRRRWSKSRGAWGGLGYSIILKRSGAIFWPRSLKMSLQKFLLCPFYCKPRPSGVSVEFPILESIPEVAANWAEVGQNHDARKAVLATLWVLKWSGPITRPRSSKGSVQKFLLCAFHRKLRPSEVSLESPGLENIP